MISEALQLSLLVSVILTHPGIGYEDQEESLLKYIPPDSEEVYLPPKFGVSQTNYSVPADGTAHLHCPVQMEDNIPLSFPLVSWVRLSDWHILTTGVVTYTKDDRISVLYKEGSLDWILKVEDTTPGYSRDIQCVAFQIKYVQISDGGLYECQISVPTGTLSKKVLLDVYRPESYIVVGNNTGVSYEFHVNHGSPVVLTCIIPLGKHNQSPQYIFWYQNDKMVNYDTERGVSVSRLRDRTESQLTITAARPEDQGNFTCSPSNTRTATVNIFVTREDKASAKKIKENSAEMANSASSGDIEMRLKLQILAVFIFSSFLTPVISPSSSSSSSFLSSSSLLL